MSKVFSAHESVDGKVICYIVNSDFHFVTHRCEYAKGGGGDPPFTQHASKWGV